MDDVVFCVLLFAYVLLITLNLLDSTLSYSVFEGIQINLVDQW